jgi:gliding motility-associated-like protein
LLRKILFILFTGLFTINGIHATHNRAGEITLTQHTDDPFTYDILIQTFTYSRSAADRNELEVQWGDGSTSIAERIQKLSLPNFYYWNKYVDTHTFPGPGTYTIVVQDPNRNFGVLNIPNSVNVIFSIKTTIVINTGIGPNSTPILLNPPIDKAAIGQVFVHNPAAYDPDGDSISYKLTVCTEENGEPIDNYTLPLASDSLYIEAVTGDLVWNTPVDTGIYNIAIEIEEWRFGVKIGSISRDMQIDVYNTDNRPPEIMPLHDFCVEAGNLLEYDILATDPDSNGINQYATGGPFLFEDSPATFDSIMTGRGFNVTRFSWQTTCNHVRSQPYNIIIKAEDDHPILKLVDISNFHIKVIGPAPENPRTRATANAILVEWDESSCPNVTSYEIYRREGRLGYVPDSCANGIPSELDYKLIGIIDRRDSTQFLDDNNGEGLIQGVEYCYMIVAIYGDGTPGFPSAEVCGVLTPGNPAVLQASVTDLDEAGSILLSWARPRELDTIPATGPYEYIIYRSDLDPMGNNLREIHRFTTTDLDDTIYVDAPVNTIAFPYSYMLELYNDEPGNRFLIGRQEIVSSTWLEIGETDNANIVRVRKNTPWVNEEYIIYRKEQGSQDYDSIGTANEPSYLDGGLRNGVEYCYQVKTIGWRSVNNITYHSINLTHFACGTPLDTIPPCPPDLEVTSFCDSSYNLLIWTNPNHTCADDVVKYHIYYTDVIDGALVLIDSTLSADDTVYFHFPPGSLAGCYAVTAIDSFNNESHFSIVVCVDNCIDYILPNVFTPNGDGMNDIFRPSNYAFVEKVDMKIYNRWGVLVYQTEDPDINWDGKRMNTNQIVPPGVYYYVCDVFENRLTGLEIRSLSGFIYVFTEPDAVNPVEK